MDVLVLPMLYVSLLSESSGNHWAGVLVCISLLSPLKYRVSLIERLPYQILVDTSLRCSWHLLRVILGRFDHHVEAVDCHRSEF